MRDKVANLLAIVQWVHDLADEADAMDFDPEVIELSRVRRLAKLRQRRYRERQGSALDRIADAAEADLAAKEPVRDAIEEAAAEVAETARHARRPAVKAAPAKRRR